MIIVCLEGFLRCGFQQEIKVELVYGSVYWKHYIKAKVLVVISFFLLSFNLFMYFSKWSVYE